MPLEYWKVRFQTSDPEEYHQFRFRNRPGTRKSNEYIRKMAITAHYRAQQPVKTRNKRRK